MKSFFNVYDIALQTSSDSLESLLETDQQVPQVGQISSFNSTMDSGSPVPDFRTILSDGILSDMSESNLPAPMAGCPTVTAVGEQEVFSDSSPCHVTDIDQYNFQESTIYDSQTPPPVQCSTAEKSVQDCLYTIATKDIIDECISMDILPEPTQWSPEDVRRWITHMCRKYLIPDVRLDLFQMNGKCLCLLSEEDFLARSPAGGLYLHSQLLIWQHYFKVEEGSECMFLDNQMETSTGFDHARQSPSPHSLSPGSPGSSSLDSLNAAMDSPRSQSPVENDTVFKYHSSPYSRKTKSDGSGAPRHAEHKQTIHLWEFLKELLQKPETFSHCIKWVDAKRGIFKIEDSVKLAKEWGRRKNRPRMDYDKLSRSIRQYYKKKIIRKTDQSKRLVYQFCDNYL